jgi:hypothetical protein
MFTVCFLKIVILHCHYERGGVTQVVENHVRWLRDCDHVDQIVLASGARVSGLSAQTLAAVGQLLISGFDYDSREFSVESLAGRARGITQELQTELANHGITKDNSVLHWHNHSLGKNTAVPAAIRLLAESGWRILLQIHDFAEDNRPENYRRLIQATGATSKLEMDQYLYPVGSQIHYATLTRGDAGVLCEVGIPESQTHCLPNSVVLPTGEQPSQDESLAKVRRLIGLPNDSRWCLYPVRGIRRKNVGEFVMLSRWIRPNQFAGLTLCPATPVEKRSYERWRVIAAEVAPKAVFDAGQYPDVTFADNVSAADFIVSTSVAEGFGMAFLEPWLAHREVIARRLPTVTDDFESSGVKLPKLYDQILIPGDAAWIRDCQAESSLAIRHAWSDLPAQFQPALDSQASDREQRIDFAKLTTDRQIEVLRLAAADPGFESDVRECSRELVGHLTSQPDDTLVQHNAAVVGREYSPERSGQMLITIYNQLLASSCDSEIESPLHAGIAVDLITRARPFFPCRTEVIDD